MPKTEKIIKNKLVKSLPRNSRERLDLCLDEDVSFKRFRSKFKTERLVVMGQAREQDNVRTVDRSDQHPHGALARTPLGRNLELRTD